MPYITLEMAKQHLQAWLEAELEITAGRSYRIGSREITKANQTEIQERINYWRNEVARLERGRRPGARVMNVIPRDL